MVTRRRGLEGYPNYILLYKRILTHFLSVVVTPWAVLVNQFLIKGAFTAGN